MKYNKSYLLEQLYSRDLSPLEFKWETLNVPGLYNYLSYYDIERLHNIATSVRYANKIKLKKEAINSILVPRGFKFFHAGTNRIVYQYLEDNRFLIKVALDEVGMSDNPTEFRVQHLLKPFVTKVFDVSPDGCVGSFERINPILNREEFASIADDVFNLLTKCILGKYIMNDIGTNSWMNYGIRSGFGVCLLDFPYCYELDGSKLYCTNPVIPNTKFPVCGGEIDYDVGFNNLVCTKCGAKFNPKDLEKKDHKNNIIIIKGGTNNMGVIIRRGNEILKSFEGENQEKVIQRNKKKTITVNKVDDLQVGISIPSKQQKTEVIHEHQVTQNEPLKFNFPPEEPKIEDPLKNLDPEIIDFVLKNRNEIEAIVEVKIPIEVLMNFVDDYTDQMERKGYFDNPYTKIEDESSEEETEKPPVIEPDEIIDPKDDDDDGEERRNHKKKSFRNERRFKYNNNYEKY